MKGLVRLWVIVYLTGALTACGQKGPLVLPDAAAKRKHTLPTLPGTATPKNSADTRPAPADANPATTPAPPASPTPQPSPSPQPSPITPQP
jgi:predicted small lipoprotein YifL